MRRAALVISNGDLRTHDYRASAGLGLVYQDQYGYVWDLEVDAAGAVHGAVEVGDEQTWPVTGTIRDGAFTWRAANPAANRNDRWSPGFEAT